VKQPTQPIAVRRSPFFKPGQGFDYSPAATMATSPPNKTTTSPPSFTTIGIEPGQKGFATTVGVVPTTVGSLAAVNIITVPLKNLPSITVPIGYYVSVIPWWDIPAIQFGSSETGKYYNMAPLVPTVTVQAYYNGQWNSLNIGTAFVAPNTTISGWQLVFSSVWIIVVSVTGSPTASSGSVTAYGGGLLVQYSA
jgi:hypothetical protein